MYYNEIETIEYENKYKNISWSGHIDDNVPFLWTYFPNNFDLTYDNNWSVLITKADKQKKRIYSLSSTAVYGHVQGLNTRA